MWGHCGPNWVQESSQQRQPPYRANGAIRGPYHVTHVTCPSHGIRGPASRGPGSRLSRGAMAESKPLALGSKTLAALGCGCWAHSWGVTPGVDPDPDPTVTPVPVA